MDWNKVFDILYFDATAEEREGIRNIHPSKLVKDLKDTIEEFDNFDWPSANAEDVISFHDDLKKALENEWGYRFPVFSLVKMSEDYDEYRLEITPDWPCIENNTFALYSHLQILRSYLPVSFEDGGIVIHMDSLDEVWGD